MAVYGTYVPCDGSDDVYKRSSISWSPRICDAKVRFRADVGMCAEIQDYTINYEAADRCGTQNPLLPLVFVRLTEVC